MNEQATNWGENALQGQEKVFSLVEILFSGGILGNGIMATILLLALMATYIFFERLFSLRRLGKSDQNFIRHIEDFVHQGRLDTALDLCKRTNSPESRMIEKGIQRMGRPISEIAEAIQNQGQLEVASFERNLSLLASASGAAPMLGFLGTVIGMIFAFFKIANIEGAVSPKLLAEGIYTAMGTTAMGLIVGIPAYFFYNYLTAKVDRIVFRMQLTVSAFLDILNKPL